MNLFFLLFHIQKKSEDMIDVCCAIIVNDNKMLAVQRGPGSSHPYKWEFPGGKINESETAENCIVREIKEELVSDVKVVTQLTPVEFDYGTRQIELIPFVCRMDETRVALTEHIQLRWLNLDDWQSLDWAEADHQLILKNFEKLRQILG